MFRYKSASDYYDNGSVLGDTNWWQMASYGQYFWFGAFSVATITQLLAIFGIANMVNLYVWMLLLGGIGGIVNLVTSILAWYAFDTAYTVSVDDTETSANVTLAEAVMSSLKEEMMMASIDGLSTDLALASVSDEWFMWNAWKAGGEEKMDDKKMEEGKERGPREPKPELELMSKVISYVNF